MRRRLRITVGLLAWFVGLTGAGWLVAGHLARDSSLSREVLPQLWRYAAGSRTAVPLEVAGPLSLGPGDPIFRSEPDGRFVQIGEIRRGAEGLPPTALFYAAAVPTSGSERLAWYSTPDSMAWVVATLLPERKRREVERELRAAIEEHREEILASLKPLVERSLNESLAIVEAELPAAIERHRGQIEAIAHRYQRTMIDKEIVPLVKKEIWPLVRRRAEPMLTVIGSDLWKRVSLWGFTWRYIYDKTPLMPRRTKVKREFRRFVDKEAVPVLERHSERIVKVVEQVFQDAAANPNIRAAARRSASRVLDDPQLRKLLWQIVRDTAVDNPRFRAAFRKTWTSPEAREALALAGVRLEPTVGRIGEILIGSAEEGFTPEFAAVLRNKLLGKDRRWLVLESSERGRPGDEPPREWPERLNVFRGRQPVTHPFLVRLDQPSLRGARP